MADSDTDHPSRAPSPLHSESEIAFHVSSQVTYHVLTPVPKGSKAKAKDKKETKTKEFMHKFHAILEAYLLLLTTILSKHGQDKYKVTERRRYGIKILCSPSHAKSEAIDIDDFDEYKDLTFTIREKKPSKITIFVDMAEVQAAFKNSRCHAESDLDSDKDDEDKDNEAMDANGLTDFERELARFRRLLEKKYQNDHDASYMYINGVTSVALHLTPVMMKEWARACYEGEATVKQPPNMEMFDPTKRQAVLNPMRQSTMVTPASVALSPNPGGLTKLSTFLTAVRRLIGPGATSSSDIADSTPITPMTPANRAVFQVAGASPATYTPSKLTHFLKYAEETLGVPNATFYEELLRCEGYGPDILHLIDDSSLTSLGISLGDTLRLKTGCITWWKGLDAKRKRHEPDDPFQFGSSTQYNSGVRTPPNKKVRSEKKFAEGGSYTFFGPRMIESDPDAPKPADKIWYFCEARQGMFPIPRGFMAIAEGEDEQDPF